MDQQQIVSAYEARAKALGLSIGEICRRAGLAQSTFSRWKLSDINLRPVGMTFSSMSAIEKALADAETSASA